MSKPVHSYFGGANWLKSARVHRLPVTGWKELVETYFRTPVSLQINRSDFHALPKPDRDTLKACSYITACSFKEDECLRGDDTADQVVLVCFDLDEGEFVKDFDEAPETIADFLFPLNHAVWRTANYTPEAPRLRIVVEVKPCAPAKHKMLVRHVANRLGLPADWKGGKESRTLSLPMARPVQFEGEEFTALIASRTNGIALDWKTVPEETVEDVKRTYAYLGDPDAKDDFDLAYLPIPDLKVEDILEALHAIDPDVNRSQWVAIGMGLRHQWRDEDQAEAAWDAFDGWSANGSKYRGEKHTYAQWKSFRPDARAGRPVTIRSLFKYAQDSGWDSGKAAAKIEKDILKWLVACQDPQEIMTEAARRIVLIPFQNEVVESSLVSAIRSRLSALKHPVEKAAIIRQIARLRVEKRREEDDGHIPSWLQPWCYVDTLDRFYHTVTGIILTPEAFNRSFAKELMPKDGDSEQARSGRPAMAPVDYSLNLKDTKRVNGVLYDPRQGAYFTADGREWANEYRQSTVPREMKRKIKWVEKVVRKLLGHMIAEPEYIEIIIDWMAFVVQNPGKKCRWCILIQSAEGAGKGILANIIGAAIGSKNLKVVGPESLAEPKFNDWMGGAQVIVLDEIWISGPGRADAMNRLKQFQTNNVIPYVRKHCGQVNIDNIANSIAFTNHHNGLSITGKDRRYCVIKSVIQTEEAAEAMTEAKLFDDPVKAIEEEAGSLRYWLMNHKIRECFDPNGRAPRTIYKDEMVRASKNRLQIEIEDLIADETEPRVSADIIDLSVLVAHTGRSERNHPPEHYLDELGYREWGNGKFFQVNGHRTKVWVHRDNHDPFFGDPAEILGERALKVSAKDL